jgi:hypothetical protein
MSLFNRISSLFTGSTPKARSGAFEVAVQCSRCGEVIRARIDLINDLSAEYGEGDGESSYHCRKVLIGKQGCYFPIEVMLKFDARRNLVGHQIPGGALLRE